MGWGRPGIGVLGLTAGLLLASIAPVASQSAGPPGPAAPATSVPPAVQPSPTNSAPQGSWAKTAGLKTARSFHSATLLADGKVLVAGGCDKYDVDPASFPQVKSCIGVTAATEVYDPARATWSPAAPMKTARMSHSATLFPSLDKRQPLILQDKRVLNTAEIYTPAGWTPPARLATPSGDQGRKRSIIGPMVAGGAFILIAVAGLLILRRKRT